MPPRPGPSPTFSALVVAGVLTLASCEDQAGRPAAPTPPVTAPGKAAPEPPRKEDAPPPLDPPVPLRGDRKPVEHGFEPAKCGPPAYEKVSVEGAGSYWIEPKTEDVIKRKLQRGEAWEKHLLPLFEKHVRPGSTVIDVGAHIGTHAIVFSGLVGRDGRVVAFEPQKKMFEELTCNLALNEISNVTPLRMGLGDTYGQLELDATSPTNEGGTSVGKGGDRAPLVPLDALTFENVSVLKVDVESFENQVLRGARRTIEEHRPIVFVEIMGGTNWDTATPEQRKEIAATAHRLTGLGYEVKRIGVWDYLAVPRGPNAKAPPAPVRGADDASDETRP